jgi:hypothetical protein
MARALQRGSRHGSLRSAPAASRTPVPAPIRGSSNSTGSTPKSFAERRRRAPRAASGRSSCCPASAAVWPPRARSIRRRRTQHHCCAPDGPGSIPRSRPGHEAAVCCDRCRPIVRLCRLASQTPVAKLIAAPTERASGMAASVKSFRTPASHGRVGTHGGRRPKSLEGGNRGRVRTDAGVDLWGIWRRWLI